MFYDFIGRKKTIVRVKGSGWAMILWSLFFLGFNQCIQIVLGSKELMINFALII